MKNMRMKIVLVLTIFVMAVGCFSSREVDKKSEVKTLNKDSLALVEANKKIASLELVVNHYEKEKAEQEYLSVNFKDCPPPINVDSLRKVLLQGGCKQSTVDSVMGLYQKAQTTIEILADGTTKIKGDLASYTKLTNKLEKENGELRSMNQKITEENSSLKTQLSQQETVTTNEKHTERKPSGWPWIIVGVMGLAFLVLLFLFLKRK